MNTSQRNVPLSGSESALVVAALFALAEWPFETPRAKSLMSNERRTAAQGVSEVVSARWRELSKRQVFGTRARRGHPNSSRGERP